MKKMKTMVNLTNKQEYDYGLSSIPLSTSDHHTQDNQTNFMIHSIFGSYHEGDNKMEEEYLEDTRNTLGSSDDEKPKTESNILKDAVETDIRTRLYQEIEFGDSGQDNHINIMTSHLSLGTNAPKEHDSNVKVRMPSPIPNNLPIKILRRL